MKAAKRVIAFAALLAAADAAAQQPSSASTWQHVVDIDGRGEINDMAVAANGDLVVAGFVPGDQGEWGDAWLARYAPDGRQLWAQGLGGSYRDEALDVDISPDGGIAIVGWRDVRPGREAQTYNGFVAKYAPNGDLVWNATLGGTRRSSLSQVMVLPDGAVLAAGSDQPNGASVTRALLAKMSPSGQIEWQINPTGAFGADSQVTTSGRLGAIRPDGSEVLFASGRIEKVHADGRIEAVVVLSGIGGPAARSCVFVSLDSGDLADGACRGISLSVPHKSGNPPAYAGGTRDGFVKGDPIVQKLGPDGAIRWTRILESKLVDGINAVARTPDGGVIAAGFAVTDNRIEMHNWDALLVKLDEDGNEVWRRSFGGGRRDEFTGVVVSADGSVFVAGYTGSQGQREWAPWIMRLNSEGELEGPASEELKRSQK